MTAGFLVVPLVVVGASSSVSSSEASDPEETEPLALPEAVDEELRLLLLERLEAEDLLPSSSLPAPEREPSSSELSCIVMLVYCELCPQIRLTMLTCTQQQTHKTD